jgi:outer membrane protein assembly factor BamA
LINPLIKVDIVLSLLLIFVTNITHSQVINDSLKADSLNVMTKNYFTMGKIIIQGNKHTNSEVILREMRIKENMSFAINELQEDMTRIYNLGLFTKVDFLPLPAGGNVIGLLITVEEMYYILPVPIGGFKGGDFKKFWGGIDFRYRNFRGMNETVGVGFALGYEPFISMSYSNPWVGEKSHLFISSNLRYGISKNNSILDTTSSTNLYKEGQIDDFDLENFNASITTGKYFTTKISSSLGIGYNYIKPSKYVPNVTLNSGGIDRFLSLVLNFSYDNRNIYEYTTYGSFIKVDYIKYGLFSDYFDFNKVRGDFREYILVNPLDLYEFSICSRVLSAVSFGGNIPSYMKEFIGKSDYLRGWKDFVAEGENKLCLFNELRLPVIKPGYVDGKKIPLIKDISYLSRFSYKYGFFWTFFYDIGGVWNKNDNFFKTSFLQSFGTGMNIIMPFTFVTRIELAYRMDNNKLIPQINVNLSNSF